MMSTVNMIFCEDHPRSRGVYCCCWPILVLLWGSSPLARGLQNNIYDNFGKPRIIPARAGFTGGAEVGPGRESDHPRSRGVYDSTRRILVTGRGSSPLARGLLRQLIAARHLPRIIPARAGFTTSGLILISPATDHPRSRGVYHGRRRRRKFESGSSPLARGLLS